MPGDSGALLLRVSDMSVIGFLKGFMFANHHVTIVSNVTSGFISGICGYRGNLNDFEDDLEEGMSESLSRL